MKKIAVVIATAVAIALLAFSAVGIMGYMGFNSRDNTAKQLEIEGDVKGFFVETLGGKEFPSKDGLTKKELREEIDTIVDFAVLKGFNSIFFEVRPDMTTLYNSRFFPISTLVEGEKGFFSLFNKFDALDYLCGAAKSKKISVYAVVNPYYAETSRNLSKQKYPSLKKELVKEIGSKKYFNPALPEVQELIANQSGEIAAKYPVAGIIFRGITDTAIASSSADYKGQLENMLSLSSQKIKAASPQKKLGIVVDGVPKESGFLIDPETASKWVTDGKTDIVIPMMTTPVDSETNDYKSLITLWSSSVLREGASVITSNPAYIISKTRTDLPFDDPQELGYQLFINTLFPAVKGAVFESYSDLLVNPTQTENVMSYMWDTSTQLPDMSLAFPSELSVTPMKSITVTPDTAKYYISGTSNPENSLTLNNNPVNRTTTNGVFGVLVDLNYGKNTFDFAQGDKTFSVSITRPKPSTTPALINKLTQTSLFPAFSYPVENEETFTIKCMGPAGGKVTAQVGNTVVSLKQVSSAVSTGVPTNYTAEISIDGYDNDLVTDLGPIAYTLNYSGLITTYKSTGSLFVKGKNATLAIEATQPMTGFYENENTVDTFIADVKAGAVDTIKDVGKTRYLTSTGGYVDFKSSKIISGKVNILNKVSRIEYEKDDKSEVYTLKGTNLPVYKTQKTETGLDVTLYNTQFDIEDLSYIQSELFEKVTLDKIDNGVILHFTLFGGKEFWGFDVSFKESDTIIYIKKHPPVSTTFARPLEGITVMLDAGHGGEDPGALGAAGEKGPVESKLNLSVAYMTKYRLEQLGATVTMTRTDDTKVDLFDRHFFAVEQKPDYFISIHHNSLNLAKDANEVSGMQVYYLSDSSKTFSEELVISMHDRLTRSIESPYLGAYYVVRQTECPAILLEVGYISNPLEQQICSDSMEIFKTACGISQAIVNSVGYNR